VGQSIVETRIFRYIRFMATTENEFEIDVMKWREERVERLRTSEKSWLGLAGLFWLKEGNNTFGSDRSCNFVLPSTAPKKAGVFNLKNDLVTIRPDLNVKISCNGGDLPHRPLRDDQQDEPDFLYLANLIMVVIKRGKSTLIRLWDIDHPLRKAFSGLNFFPYKPEYRITAQYTGYEPFKLVRQEDIIGETHDTKMIGTAFFEWEGKQFRLDAEDGGDGLFIAFKDKTNLDATYAGGRYLQTEKPQNGQVVLDFNKAYNMPCAYTLYATCTLATPENRLPIAIEAGEKKFQDRH
jgi:uncharacterized protein (DUF1684 family)